MSFSDPYDQQRLIDLTNQAKGSSYSGTDITATIVMPVPTIPKVQGSDDEANPYTPRPSVLINGEIQTITVSSARSIAPVRTLGTVPPQGYTRGARTIAGTMIFSNLLRDSFIEHYQQGRESGETDFQSFFVDQLPSFDIVLTAANEYGAIANSVIKGVTISNFGTTMSVDDMYMESTYTYVAENFWPFVEDSATVKRLLSEQVSNERKASQEAMAKFMGIHNTVLDTYRIGVQPHATFNPENLERVIEETMEALRNIGEIKDRLFSPPSSSDVNRYLHGNRGYL